ESEERTNIHTGEKYTDISSQYVVLDREILLSGDESAIKKHINERIKKAGIKSEVSSVKPAAKTIQSKSEIISKAKMKYQNALQNIAYWRLIDKDLKSTEDVIEAVKGSETEEVMFEAMVYHGSPYQFDKFSTDKIGTGEGAQAYGYGLYFSSKEQVAKWYAEQLGRAPMLIDENLLTSEDKDKLQKAINFERDIDGITYDYK